MIRRALKSDVQGDFDVKFFSFRDEALEIRQRSQLRVNDLVAAFFGADSPGASHITWLRLGCVVLALAKTAPDGVNRRQVEYIESHLLDIIELCRNIAIIDHGRIIENTAMKNLLGKLDVETFVLDLVNVCDTLPTVDGVKLTRVDDHTIEAEMSRAHDLNSLFAALSARGITVVSMRNKANRLEELFVRLIDANDKAAA